MTKRHSWLMGVLVVGMALCAPAQAGPDLVVNGGFETNDFTGWTQIGDTSFSGVDGNPFTGLHAAFFGPVGTTGGITQNINVGAAGQRFMLDFAFDPDGNTPSSFSVSFGGQTLLSLTNPADAPYTLFHLGGITTGAVQALTFNFRDDPGFLFLDAVTLVVPEPATMGLLGAGLAGLFFSRRRKTA